MRVFLTRNVARFVRAEGISDDRLADAIARAERGLIDADLGGGLIKQRVARPGQSKRGGWRTLIAYRRSQRSVFLFGFAKNDLDNIDDDYALELKAAAHDVLALTTEEIAKRLIEKTLVEVPYGKKD
jgi:hypothetical protein